MDRKTIKTALRRTLPAVGLGLLLAAVVLAVIHLLPPPEVPMPSASVPVVSVPPPEPEPEKPDNPIDFAAQQDRYPDTVAWIRVPGTVIDYPVMQSGADLEEDYFLSHDIDRRYKFAGSIYMQKMNQGDFSDPNTVLYGHNMKNGSMFAAVHKFKKKDFFEKNQLLYVYTPGHILTYRIYSVFVYDDRHLMYSFDFDDPLEYASFLHQTLHPDSQTKQVREGVVPNTNDRVITLSTCTNVDTQRLLLVAVLEQDTLTK